MFARIATYRGIMEDQLEGFLPKLQKMTEREVAGLEEILVVLDRQTGTAQSILFFDTDESMRAASKQLENAIPMTEAGGVRTDIEHYEVLLRERPGA